MCRCQRFNEIYFMWQYNHTSVTSAASNENATSKARTMWHCIIILWKNPFLCSSKVPISPGLSGFFLHPLQNRTTTTTKSVLQPFCWDHPGQPVPEENFWTLWCKGRLTEADTPTTRLGATPAELTSAHLQHPHQNRTFGESHIGFFTGRMPFVSPNQQCQSM